MNWKNSLFVFLLVVGLFFIVSCQQRPQKFQPTFESLEKANAVPEWFKDAKFGIYFHWGVYSVPAYSSEWYPRTMYKNGSKENLHHKKVYGDVTEWPYNNFITGAKDKHGNFVQFNPKLKSEGGKFDPEEWAQLFADAGAKFAGPVAEHHDGFSMWASDVNPWNAKTFGPKLDLVGMFTDAIREKNIKTVLSMHHAYNITGFYEAAPKTDDPKLQMLFGQQGKEKNESFWLAKHKEIIDKYKPDIIWQDFNLHLISQPILLQFLAYYYNQAASWNKEVVATYKDGLNTKCAVLDYERGGPVDLTENYWLTDDAISSSSWCYTEGIGYYSKIQILHAFIDRISKNGNLLLNISPKADGSIPQEQKEILLSMGDWLKKYGEAVYATRAWEIYGEGPTKMGAQHGVFIDPAEGTSRDIRFTRSKDKTKLFAILLGIDKGQKKIVLSSLSSNRIDLNNLNSVELINGKAGKYLPLEFVQDKNGLIVNLPGLNFDDMAYVLKLNFEGQIPPYNNYSEINCDLGYHIVPNGNNGSLVFGDNLVLSKELKNKTNQWKFELSSSNGCYTIYNRDNTSSVLECSNSSKRLNISDFTGEENQIWKIDDLHSGIIKISNKKYPNLILNVDGDITEGAKVTMAEAGSSKSLGWNLMEICDLPQEAFKKHQIPGTIEAEDYDIGCPRDSYFDTGDENSGSEYRPDEGVDIEVCLNGGYNIGWTYKGEWMEYTVDVEKSGDYELSLYVATDNEEAKLHLECDDENITGIISLPNTAGFQNWTVIKSKVNLSAGKRIIKVFIDERGLNLDKMIFKKI